MEGAPNPQPADVQPPLTPGALVVLGTTWTDDGCLLRLRRPGHDSELVAARGLELNYQADLDGPRHCVGHRSPRRNDGAYVECRNRAQPGEKTCVSCAVADAEFASDLHHAHTRNRDEIHQSVLRHLQRTNILYLAAFRDGSIKVGTSTETRRTTRLIEQGAWRAVAAATVVDGFAVRRLEDLVTERLGLAQSVAVRRKLKGMISPQADADLERALADRLVEVHALLASDEGLAAGEATPTGQWWAFPAREGPGDRGDEDRRDSDRPDRVGGPAIWSRLHPYPVRLDGGCHHLRIEAMCGRLAVLTRPDGRDRFVADLGTLYGRQLEVGAFEPDELVVQDSLF